VLFQVVHRQPPPARKWKPDLPGGVVAVVNRALEKDLARRFASAGDMRAALAIARDGLGSAKPAAASPPPSASASASQRLAPPPLPASAAPATATKPPGTIPPPLRSGGRSASASARVAPPPRTDLRPLLVGGGAAMAALVVVAAGFWLRERAQPAPPPPQPAASTTAATDALTQELVRKQLRLAHAELDDKNYKVAISEAEGVLKLAPGNPEAAAVVQAAQERLAELERAVAETRRLADAGDNEGASRELVHVLELDPRHEAAAELGSRLNSVFTAQAEAAASEMRTARDAAARAGAAPEPLRNADAAATRAQELMARGEFAQATRTYLEARDSLDRARRSVAPRRPAETPRPGATSSAAVSEPRVSATLAPPPAAAAAARSFVPDATSIATPPSRGGPAGFDGVAGRAAQFHGRMEFEVLPPAVRPGDPFVVRIHLRNEGRKSVKIRGLVLAAVIDGRRTAAPATPLLREVQGQTRGLVAEYSAVWASPREWVLEAVVTADKDETVTSRLKAN
jgi:tetratricopeptide (TPR) repeat protein